MTNTWSWLGQGLQRWCEVSPHWTGKATPVKHLKPKFWSTWTACLASGGKCPEVKQSLHYLFPGIYGICLWGENQMSSMPRGSYIIRQLYRGCCCVRKVTSWLMMSWLVKRLCNHAEQWTTSGLNWIGSRWEGSSSLILCTNKWVILYFLLYFMCLFYFLGVLFFVFFPRWSWHCGTLQAKRTTTGWGLSRTLTQMSSSCAFPSTAPTV